MSAQKRFQTVGVVGAGVMGCGLAQSLAASGHDVVLVDLTPEVLEQAGKTIRQNLRYSRLRAPSSAKEPTSAVLERVHFTTDYESLGRAEFVIENVTERWDIKKEVYGHLHRICGPEVIIGVNTSAISITKVSSLIQNPARVIGMHFMNPVPMKPLVELIRGYYTDNGTIEAASTLLAQMGKEGIVVEDMPGFVTNRVLMLTVNEAVFVVQDGVAEAKEVDRIFRGCFGHTMGPLETADLIGLDTILDSLVVLYESYNDDKYRPAPLLKKLVAAGLLGRKSGHGFYPYSVDSPSSF
ncbi:MAG: 3-hydroxyacyl-CoA dehydrogenase NAD-binding domain-containing protein [Bacteroidota bacterium]